MSTIASPPTGERHEGEPVPGPAAPGSPTSGSPARERSYRYPGSPPFRDIDLDRRLFKGRDEEAKKVFHSILSADLFLLYAVSGMGKSSLLNAGVMHRLRARGYWPVNVRLNDTTLSPVQSIDRQIALADIRDTEVEVQRTPGLDFDITADTTLWDLLGSLEVWRGDRLQQLVVVLDQFEELFTLDWKADVRDRFIAEFGQVVRGHRSVDSEAVAEASAVPVPNVKFCIVIREDALGQLEALADDVPQIMQNRFRLGALDATQAELAIREPAMVDDGLLDTPPFGYSEAAARQILDFLRETERAAMLHLGEVDTDTSVDPSQLQIICQYIERRVLPAKGIPPAGEVVTITTDDLGGAEGLRSVLGDFYRRTVATFPPAKQRSVQRLCEEGLISKSGRRLSVERDEIAAHYDVSGAILDELVDQRLLRVEPRVGSTYYELSHDTLVRPILADRAERRKARSRRLRRFAFVAGAAAALLVIGFVVYSFGFREGKDSVAFVEFGESAQGNIEGPAAVGSFQVASQDEPSVVLVEPSNDSALNATVTVTNSNDESRVADQLRRGEDERIVVPAGTGERLDVAVSSNDASTGGFEISQEGVRVTPLLANGTEPQTLRGSINAPGLLAVYSVEVSESSTDGGSDSVEIVVTSPDALQPPTDSPLESDPTRQLRDRQDQSNNAGTGLDVVIEVIDDEGAGTTINSNADVGAERTTLFDAGSYLVIVRGDDTGIGRFELTASRERYVPLTLDEAKPGVVPSAEEPAVFAVDVPSDRNVVVNVTPTGDFDPVLETVDSNGEGLSTDSGLLGETEFANLTGAGRQLVRVSGFEGDVGAFDIVATSLATAELVNGVSSAAPTPVVFEVSVAPGELLSFVAESTDPASVLSIEVTDSEGISAGATGAPLEAGQPATAVFDGTNFPGSYVITVDSTEPDTEVTATIQPVKSRRRLRDEPVTAPAPAEFDVDVSTGQTLTFTARPHNADSFLALDVLDAGGFPTGSVGTSPSAGEPATVTIDGGFSPTYRVIVSNSGGPTDVTASLQAVEPERLVLGGAPVSGVAPTSFDIDVAAGERGLVIVTPDDDDESLFVTIFSPDSEFPNYVYGFGPDQPAVAVLDGEGTHRVTVGVDPSAPGDGSFTLETAVVETGPEGR